MTRRTRLILQAVAALVLVWLVVFAVRSIAGSQRVTAEKLEQSIREADFEDWSERDSVPGGATAERREERLREIADQVNRLDFAEREKTRDERIGEEFFRRLSRSEKELFIDLTIEKSMETFMQALDALEPAERRKFVEDGLREIEDGRTEEEMLRARELSEDLLGRITEEGMKSYFENASVDTKLDLAPLMEAMDDVMKGMKGGEFMQQR